MIWTALRKPREERSAVCDQQVELLRQCNGEYQYVSETWPGSLDSPASNLPEVLDVRVLYYVIHAIKLCQALPEPQKTCIVCKAILCCPPCSDTSLVTSAQFIQGLFLISVLNLYVTKESAFC